MPLSILLCYTWLLYYYLYNKRDNTTIDTTTVTVSCCCCCFTVSSPSALVHSSLYFAGAHGHTVSTFTSNGARKAFSPETARDANKAWHATFPVFMSVIYDHRTLLLHTTGQYHTYISDGTTMILLVLYCTHPPFAFIQTEWTNRPNQSEIYYMIDFLSAIRHTRKVTRSRRHSCLRFDKVPSRRGSSGRGGRKYVRSGGCLDVLLLTLLLISLPILRSMITIHCDVTLLQSFFLSWKWEGCCVRRVYCFIRKTILFVKYYGRNNHIHTYPIPHQVSEFIIS